MRKYIGILTVVVISGGALFFFYAHRSTCTMIANPSGGFSRVCPPDTNALPLGLPTQPVNILGQPSPEFSPLTWQLGDTSGVVAGIHVTQQFPSWMFSHDSNATTTPVLTAAPDTGLDPATMHVVSVDPFVLLQKSDGVHVEYIYNAGIVAPEDAVGIAEPQLVPSGVVFRDQYGTPRVFALGDGGIVAGLPPSKTLTFVASSTRYLSDGRGVYFFTYMHRALVETAEDATAHTVRGADPKTFKVLYAEANFAGDANHFFLNGDIVPDMTPQSVWPFPHQDSLSYDASASTRYSDAQWLYTIGFNIDPSEQGSGGGNRNLNHGVITKELLKNIYYRKVQDIDPNCAQDKHYMIKSDGIWYGDIKISTADSTHFELIVGFYGVCTAKGGAYYEYARDDTSVYYQGVRIPNADRATFLPTPLNPAYAADKSHVFFAGQVISNADPVTFEPLWFPIYEGCSLGTYARDRTHVFYKNKVVESADPNSFTPLLEDYGRDSKGIYLRGVFQPHIDPRTFTDPVCNYG